MTVDKQADVSKRILGTGIDLLIALVAWRFLTWILPWVGEFVAALVSSAFLLLRDTEGMSPGKKLMGIRTVLGNGAPCDHVASIKRNIFVAAFYLSLAALLVIVGILPVLRAGFARFFAFSLGTLCLALELFKVVTDKEGLRLGDLLADTRVIENDLGATTET